MIWVEERKINLSNNWLYGFLRCWNDRLSTLNPRKLESNRAKCARPEAVILYFENLQDIISKYNLNNKQQCIYNLDETGLQPEHRPPNVISPPNSKPQARPKKKIVVFQMTLRKKSGSVGREKQQFRGFQNYV